MKVYLVYYYSDAHYEEHLDVVAICSTEEKAIAMCEKMDSSYKKYSYDEFMLDEVTNFMPY